MYERLRFHRAPRETIVVGRGHHDYFWGLFRRLWIRVHDRNPSQHREGFRILYVNPARFQRQRLNTPLQP